MADKMVRVYDPESKRTITISARELAPGMILTRTEGEAEDVWKDASTLTAGGPVRHPPLPDSRPIFEWFSRLFATAMPQTPEQWEIGFRRDVNYAKEIFLWAHVAEVFERLTADR